MNCLCKSDLAEKSVLLDADVIRHFHKARMVEKLGLIFPKKTFVLDMVIAEIQRSPHLKGLVSSLAGHGIAVINFQGSNSSARREYFRLQSQNLGPGEAASMIHALNNKNILASSNLRDIARYCGQNNIPYLTTSDMLCLAEVRGILTRLEANTFIQLNIERGSRMPFENMEEYDKSKNNLYQVALSQAS